MDTSDLAEIRHALVQECGLTPVGAEASSREALVGELARRLDYLLRHDLDRLMSYLYMLDVPEARFLEAISRPEADRPAHRLAEVVLDREAEKLRTRRQYEARDSGGDGSQLPR